MKILVFNRQKDLPLSSPSVRSVVKQVLLTEQRSTDELSLYFVTTEEICHLHEQFFDDPSPTDCISFPMDEREKTDYHILGEVFVCPQAAIEQVMTIGEAYQEATLYLVHGILHLLGYDDIRKSDIKKMREAEARNMKALIDKKNVLRG